jgi:PAS domain S-box-containing protein
VTTNNSITRCFRVCIGLLFFTIPTLCAQAASPKRVLILNPFARDVEPFNAAVSSFRAVLVRELGEPVDFHEIPLELARFTGPEGESPLVAFLEERLTSQPVDLVVPINGAGMQFAARHRSRLFPEAQILAAAAEPRMAPRILRGEKTGQIPPQILDAAVPINDRRELRRWNISEATLPPGSITQFLQPSFWEHHRWQVIGVISFGLLPVALITGLMANRNKQRRSEAEATMIADISSKFVNLPADQVDHEIFDAQRRICELIEVDLSALWQRTERHPGSFTATHLYSLEHGPQLAGERTDDDFPWVRQEILAGRVVAHRSLADMPAAASKDREAGRKLGIKSHLTLPLSIGGQSPIGILGFNTTRRERDWPDALIKRLQTVAQIFANALARKLADQSLRESELRLGLAADSAGAGLWELNWVTRKFWANERARAMFGFSPDEVIGLERFQASIHPGDWDRVWVAIDRSVRSAVPVEVECRIHSGDGPVQWIISRGRPFFNTAGEPERILGLSMDVTGRKRSEAALQASEARLATGTELVGLGYYEVDNAAPFSFVDERFEEICGIPAGRQEGLQALQFWIDHLHPDDRHMVLGEREKLHDGTAQQLSIEYRYQHPSGGQKWIHHLARVVERDANQRSVRIFGVLRDITEQKRAELEAQELRDNLTHLSRVTTLGALSSSLAHELNQPLGVILSNAQAAQELLAQDPPDLAEVRDILDDIVTADRRAGEVIERLRALIKRGQVSLQAVPLNQIIEDVLHLIRVDLIRRGVTVVPELAADLPHVEGDRVQLQQVVLNLLLNAADAMATNGPEARRLHLQTVLHEGRVRASVRDEGPGLAEDPERLFQPFYTTKDQGLGLGLAICWSIVAAHQGRLWAEPNAGRGAVFHFELPAAGSPDSP